MSFEKIKDPKKFKNDIYTLRYLRSFNNERTFSFFPYCKAVIAVEAAIIIPLFLFFILGICSILIILGLQTSIQTGIENTARALGQKAYYIEKTNTEGLGLNPITVRSYVLSDELKDTVDRSSIVGGASGLSFALTTYDAESGVLEIVVTYRYRIPFLPTAFSSLNFTQRCKTHVWTGRKLDTAGEGDESETEKRTVYVTETGTVYHLSKGCPYLDLSISTVSSNTVSSLRNKGGAKYYACPLCGKGGVSGIVYITDYGTCYHTNLSCSGLKRTIREIDISEVGDMPACSKCGRDSEN